MRQLDFPILHHRITTSYGRFHYNRWHRRGRGPLQVRLPEPTRGDSSAVTAGEAAGKALQSSLLESNGGAQEKAQGILLAVWKEPLQRRREEEWRTER